MCSFDIVSAAQKHAIARDVASPDFFEGALLGNGDLGVVVNEALLWGHRDVVELFPNWDKNNAAAFTWLRTKGAFLVDAACSAGTVEYVAVTSERGGVLQIRNPWEAAADEQGKVYTDDVIAIPTSAGDAIRLRRAEWLKHREVQ